MKGRDGAREAEWLAEAPERAKPSGEEQEEHPLLQLQRSHGNAFVQRLIQALGAPDGDIHAAAQRGIRTPAVPLPFLDRIQRSFGAHNLSGVQAHTGTEATAASHAMNAAAYATGNHVVFAGTPDLRTAAHEAAHVVQQRAGVHLSGGVGREGDAYERHADEVADKVVRGESAEGLLGAPQSSGRDSAVQLMKRRAEGDIEDISGEEDSAGEAEHEEISSKPKKKVKPIPSDFVRRVGGGFDVFDADQLPIRLVNAYRNDLGNLATYLGEGEGEVIAGHHGVEATVFEELPGDDHMIRQVTVLNNGGGHRGTLLFVDGNHYIVIEPIAEEDEDYVHPAFTDTNGRRYRRGAARTVADGNCLVHGILIIAGEVAGSGVAAPEQLNTAFTQERQFLREGGLPEDSIRINLTAIIQDVLAGVMPQGLGPNLTMELNADPLIKASKEKRSQKAGKMDKGARGGGDQGSLAVQIELGEDGSVAAIHMAGRPKGLLVGKEGKHTSAWAMICDEVRQTILGLDPAAAIGEMEALATNLQRLPGWGRERLLHGETKARFLAALADLGAACERAREAAKGRLSLPALQDLIGAYLTMRQRVPLSAIDDGPRSPGGGEPAGLREVRSGRGGGLLTLIDSVAVFRIHQHIYEIGLPGCADIDTEDGLVEEVIAQFLIAAHRAYPAAYANANLDNLDTLAQFVRDIRNEAIDKLKLREKKKDEIVIDEDGEPERQPPKWNVSPARILELKRALAPVDGKKKKEESKVDVDGATGSGAFSVQVVIDPGTGNLANILVGGRPPDLPDKMGRHTAAWIVMVDMALTNLVGKSVAQALVEVGRLAAHVRSLPGMDEARLALLDKDQRQRVAEARGRTEVPLPKKMTDQQAFGELQTRIDALLSLRNLVPLSEIVVGGNADGDHEGGKRAKLKSGDKAVGQYAEMWGMLDVKSVLAYMQKGSQRDGPGRDARSDKSIIDAVSDIILQFLLSMQIAYPDRFQEAGLASKRSVTHFVGKLGSMLEDQIIAAVMRKWGDREESKSKKK